MSTPENIRNKAYSAARQLVRNRLAESAGAAYEKLGPTEKMNIDRAIETKQTHIKKIALKLIPQIANNEKKRKDSFTAGSPLSNNGSPEKGDVHEALNKKFSLTIKSTEKKPETKKGKSPHIIVHNTFGEEVALDSPVYKALLNKAEKANIDITIIGEIYNRGISVWYEDTNVSQQQYAFARVNSFINKGKTYFNEDSDLAEDLRKWFDQKWVRMDTKGKIKGDCAREEGEGKPKCLPMAQAQAMDPKDRAKAARRKRREDPVADREGKGGKPINVATEAVNPAQQAAIAIAMKKAGKKPIKEEQLDEKNSPTNPTLWSKAKSLARQKFDVYPSAYANGWAAKWYKSKGGGWNSANEEFVDTSKGLNESFNMAFDYQGKPTLAPTAHQLMMKTQGGFAHHNDVKDVMNVTAIKEQIEKAFQATILEEDKDELSISMDNLIDMVNEAFATIENIKSANIDRDAWSQAQILKLERYIESVAAYINNMNETVRSGESHGVIVPAHTIVSQKTGQSITIPAKTKNVKKNDVILHPHDNPFDGK